MRFSRPAVSQATAPVRGQDDRGRAPLVEQRTHLRELGGDLRDSGAFGDSERRVDAVNAFMWERSCQTVLICSAEPNIFC